MIKLAGNIAVLCHDCLGGMKCSGENPSPVWGDHIHSRATAYKYGPHGIEFMMAITVKPFYALEDMDYSENWAVFPVLKHCNA